MRSFRLRFTIGQVMGFVASVALALALLPTPVVVVGSMLAAPYGGVLVVARMMGVPAARATAWMLAGYPLVALLGVYATWTAGCAMLGRLPRPVLDDPVMISPVVSLLYIPTIWSLIGLYPAAFLGLGFLFNEAADHFTRKATRRDAFVGLITLAILSWVGGFFILASDPGGVMNWFMD